MADMTLWVDQRGAELALSSAGVVCLRYPDGTTHRVGLRGLRQIVVQGEVQLSSQLLRACNQAQVGVLLLPARGPGEAVPLFPYNAGQVRLRHAQHRCYADPAQRLRLARVIVAAKIRSQQERLHACGQVVDLQALLVQVPTAPDIATLMGIEGAAAARYFASWGRLWRTPWHFPGRNRQPPRDPVNALLSLGYALTLHQVGQLAATRGLDPALGFLHTPQSGRPALGLDLLEPLRPWVDQWVLRYLNNSTLTPAQFTTSAAEGCRLGKAARSGFYGQWYRDEDDWLRPVARAVLALLLRELHTAWQAHDFTS